MFTDLSCFINKTKRENCLQLQLTVQTNTDLTQSYACLQNHKIYFKVICGIRKSVGIQTSSNKPQNVANVNCKEFK